MKSANVFLNMNGSVKLGDMNVSKVSKNGLLYTQTGTPYYASPEVWQDKPYNSKSDIWSLGCVLYEAAALKPPFRAEDMQGLYEKIIKGEFASIQSHFSKDLRLIIRQLLQIDPSKRPSCDQILRTPAVQRHLINFAENLEPSVLLSSIKVSTNKELMTESLPRPKYSPKNQSENASVRISPSLKKSPSKSVREEINKSFIIKENSYSPITRHYREYKEILKESYGALKLPKIRYPGKNSPQPIRKLREIEEYLSMPKSLPASDRLKKLRDAYLSKPIKLFIN